MTDLAQRTEYGLGGRIGRLAFRALIATILVSPIAVGFWLAPKADDMPPPPELTAPPTVTNLPDAVRRVWPVGEHQSQSVAPPATVVSSGG
jgi:hypothetical protein